MFLSSLLVSAVSIWSTVAALPQSQPSKDALSKRQSSTSSDLAIDLGYEIYQGFANSTTGINTWRGIRFAAPPTGSLRWQRPQAPVQNRSSTIQADTYGPVCNQIGDNSPFELGAATSEASEDCLFLNVQSPANATNLPVLVWIHGGGYGSGNGQTDFTPLLTTTGNKFITVSIQYRLGAFGFLASDEVVRKGVANAGLLDQFFALHWVQTYIRQFGGDPSAVTISGESAGAGSVMLQDMAYGGSLGDSLFRSTIAASPYLPKQYKYNDWVPTQDYNAFAHESGCALEAYGNVSNTLFDCLVSKDVATLQNASVAVTAQATYGTWVFLPVTDGVFIQDAPSDQLLEKRVNGRNLLVGNNANEGPLFTPQDIVSQSAFLTWLRNTLPDFSEDDIAKVLLYYPDVDMLHSTDFATAGTSGPSALNQSSLATGQQQRANNIYAELTFVCPTYWMAEAYSGPERKSYKYQFSVLPATHGSDVAGYFGALGATPYLGVDFQRAFQTIWANFITQETPQISNSIAVGSSSNVTATENAASTWSAYTIANPYLLDLNQTGGTATEAGIEVLSPVNTTIFAGPGLQNNITSGNAFTWEDGRGVRCDFWKSVARKVPE